MQPRNINRFLNRTTAGILSAAVCVGVWGWMADGYIVEKTDRSNSNSKVSRNGPVATNKDIRSRSSDEQLVASELLNTSEIWNRSLQSGFQAKSTSSIALPMTSPVAPRPNVVIPKASPDVGLRLVGTVIEQGRSIAIAIDQAGKLDFCREGDSLQLEPEGVHVESVSDKSVRVSFKGQASTWLMGQSLRFESDERNPNQPKGVSPRLSNEVPVPTQSPTQPKMSLEEELDLINGVQPSVPL